MVTINIVPLQSNAESILEKEKENNNTLISCCTGQIIKTEKKFFFFFGGGGGGGEGFLWISCCFFLVYLFVILMIHTWKFFTISIPSLASGEQQTAFQGSLSLSSSKKAFSIILILESLASLSWPSPSVDCTLEQAVL